MTAVHRMCDGLGITYRQYDYWASQGWLGGPSLAGFGSGIPRQLTGSQQRVLRRMAALVNSGMHPEAASRRALSETASPEELTLAWAAGRGEMS